MLAYYFLIITVRPYRSSSGWLIVLVEQAALLLFIALCVIVKADQLSAELGKSMTAERHARYFSEHGTEAIANLMVGSIVTAVAAAALVSMWQTGREVTEVWPPAMRPGPSACMPLRRRGRLARRDRAESWCGRQRGAGQTGGRAGG